jgi:hypothetical protein
LLWSSSRRSRDSVHSAPLCPVRLCSACVLVRKCLHLTDLASPISSRPPIPIPSLSPSFSLVHGLSRPPISRRLALCNRRQGHARHLVASTPVAAQPGSETITQLATWRSRPGGIHGGSQSVWERERRGEEEVRGAVREETGRGRGEEGPRGGGGEEEGGPAATTTSTTTTAGGTSGWTSGGTSGWLGTTTTPASTEVLASASPSRKLPTPSAIPAATAAAAAAVWRGSGGIRKP